MTEEFLHHIWKFRLFDQFELFTTNNQPVEIFRAGDQNTDAGPDFFNARIKIGDTLWAGNVEVHVRASDWNKHQHQSDKAYDNIILHVVYQADVKLYRSNGEEIFAVELRTRIRKNLLRNYENFKTTSEWIPCAKQIGTVPGIIINNTIDKLLLERLSSRADSIGEQLRLNNNNWEETFYQLLARNFGFKTNASPFELLAKSLPSSVLAKHKSSLLQIEALLFGQAGLLEEHFDEPYVIALQNEYSFLRKKFRLQPMQEHLWKFLRLRPANFPSVRIAQFAYLIHSSSHMFSKALEAHTIDELENMLDVSVSDYWLTHYMLNKPVRYKLKKLGNEGVRNIIINTIIPFLFVYGKHRREEQFCDRALYFLETLKGERNEIVRMWQGLKLPVKNAGSTQALLQLKNEYCNHKKCLSCNIGNYLIKNS